MVLLVGCLLDLCCLVLLFCLLFWVYLYVLTVLLFGINFNGCLLVDYGLFDWFIDLRGLIVLAYCLFDAGCGCFTLSVWCILREFGYWLFSLRLRVRVFVVVFLFAVFAIF